LPVRGRVVSEGIRFAAEISSDPSAVVTLWKALTGGYAAGFLPSTPVPELLHAAGLLPIPLDSPEDPSRRSFRIDVCLPGIGTRPANVEEALDRMEALSEWASTVSGSPASEGAIWKSIRAFDARRVLLSALEERYAKEPDFLTPGERGDIVRSGSFLPPEAHSRLLALILGIDHDPASPPAEEERGDPLIVLAKRLM